MSSKRNLFGISRILSSLTSDDNPDRLRPLIRQIDFQDTSNLSKKELEHVIKARKHMDKMVKDKKITTKGIMNATDNLMSASKSFWSFHSDDD